MNENRRVVLLPTQSHDGETLLRDTAFRVWHFRCNTLGEYKLYKEAKEGEAKVPLTPKEFIAEYPSLNHYVTSNAGVLVWNRRILESENIRFTGGRLDLDLTNDKHRLFYNCLFLYEDIGIDKVVERQSTKVIYIQDEMRDAKERNKKHELVSKCYTYLAKLTSQQKINLCCLFSTDVITLDAELASSILYEELDKDYKGFYTKITTKGLIYQVMVELLIQTKIVRVTTLGYVFEDVVLANSKDEFIQYFKTPTSETSNTLVALQRQLETIYQGFNYDKEKESLRNLNATEAEKESK